MLAPRRSFESAPRHLDAPTDRDVHRRNLRPEPENIGLFKGCYDPLSRGLLHAPDSELEHFGEQSRAEIRSISGTRRPGAIGDEPLSWSRGS